jgi:hypothetical protein
VLPSFICVHGSKPDHFHFSPNNSFFIKIICEYYQVSWGGVRLSSLGTSATNWPIVPASDDKWVCSIWWNENWQGKPKYSEKTCPSATLSTTNPTRPDLGSNAGRRGGKPVTAWAKTRSMFSCFRNAVQTEIPLQYSYFQRFLYICFQKISSQKSNIETLLWLFPWYCREV